MTVLFCWNCCLKSKQRFDLTATSNIFSNQSQNSDDELLTDERFNDAPHMCFLVVNLNGVHRALATDTVAIRGIAIK
jgi:hypothetical protein